MTSGTEAPDNPRAADDRDRPCRPERANVRQIFNASGMSNSSTSFSQVTGAGYEMTCVGRYPEVFNDGSTKVSTRRYGGDSAEIVIW